MRFGDFLNNLAAKLELQNDPQFIALLTSTELSGKNIDDALAAKFDEGLMSFNGAKSRTDLLSHFRPTILNPLDSQLAILAEKYGIQTEMGGEKNTYKKVELLESKLAELIRTAEAKATQAGGNKSEEITKLNKQLAELQQQLTAATESKNSELAKMAKQYEKAQLNTLVNFELNGKTYANKDLGSVNVQIARQVLDNALAERKATLVNVDGKVCIKQADNTALDILDEGNKPIQFKEFTDKLLAEKKLLAVNGTTQVQNPKPQTPFHTYQDGQGGSGQLTKASGFDAAFDQAIADGQ